MNFFKHIFIGWKTTLIGLVILACALTSILKFNVSWGDASIGLFLGTGLLFSPDSIITAVKDHFKGNSPT